MLLLVLTPRALTNLSCTNCGLVFQSQLQRFDALHPRFPVVLLLLLVAFSCLMRLEGGATINLTNQVTSQ